MIVEETPKMAAVQEAAVPIALEAAPLLAGEIPTVGAVPEAAIPTAEAGPQARAVPLAQAVPLARAVSTTSTEEAGPLAESLAILIAAGDPVQKYHPSQLKRKRIRSSMPMNS